MTMTCSSPHGTDLFGFDCYWGCPRGGTYKEPPKYPAFVKAPDYSTPAKVSARARERGTPGAFPTIDQRFTKLYRDFVKTCGQLPPPDVVDRHTSRWVVVNLEPRYPRQWEPEYGNDDGGWCLFDRAVLAAHDEAIAENRNRRKRRQRGVTQR